jgi:hypothetical protein
MLPTFIRTISTPSILKTVLIIIITQTPLRKIQMKHKERQKILSMEKNNRYDSRKKKSEVDIDEKGLTVDRMVHLLGVHHHRLCIQWKQHRK